MHSDLIGKIEKAHRYAEEKERVVIDELRARFYGGNNNHSITLSEDLWDCDCEFFHKSGTCAHVMALQKMLTPMLPADVREAVRSVPQPEVLMHSAMIGKIEKARQYAQQPERVVIDELLVRFRGGNNDHKIAMTDGEWNCDCSFHRTWSTCAHVMALQMIFDPMLPPKAREASSSVAADDVIVGALS